MVQKIPHWIGTVPVILLWRPNVFSPGFTGVRKILHTGFEWNRYFSLQYVLHRARMNPYDRSFPSTVSIRIHSELIQLWQKSVMISVPPNNYKFCERWCWALVFSKGCYVSTVISINPRCVDAKRLLIGWVVSFSWKNLVLVVTTPSYKGLVLLSVVDEKFLVDQTKAVS